MMPTIRRGLLRAMLTLGFLAAGWQLPVRAITPAEADLAFAALNQVYWNPDARFFRKEENGSKWADFWLEAQLWDTVMDQFDRTHSDAVKRQIGEVYDGFIEQHPDWTRNKYNDDIMWWAIACTRAYQITQDDRYLIQAQASFDFVLREFGDDTFGGGVWWTSDRTSKNSCIVSPAVIAAVRLAEALNNPAYLATARRLYDWQRRTLTDGTGKVFDSIRADAGTHTNRTDKAGPADGSIAKFSLTYNQGTYIGASVLLHRMTGESMYLAEAKKTADWTRAHLCTGPDRILQNENQGDGGAFKGIFVRYMKLLVRDGGATEFVPWMQANAETAWRHRRAADNIMGYDWSVPAGRGIQSQSASSAVSLLLCFADERQQ